MKTCKKQSELTKVDIKCSDCYARPINPYAYTDFKNVRPFKYGNLLQDIAAIIILILTLLYAFI